jgi:hypothetical protein
MKKIILALIVCTCNAVFAAAQDKTDVVIYEVDNDFREDFMFGLKAGANYSNVYDAQGEAFQNDAKFGFAGGVFLSVPIGKFLGIQPEVLYSQKGFHATGKMLGSTYDFTRTTNYLDIPLYIAIKPSRFLTILAGPQYCYLLSQKDVFATNVTSSEVITDIKNDNIRKNILSVSGGFDINIRHAVIGGRVAWDVSNNNGNGTSTTPRYKNTWFQATIGYRI